MKKLLVSVFVILLVFSCKKENKDAILLDPSQDQEILSQYFSAATSGMISASDHLVFVLNKPLISVPNDDQLQSLIEIRPTVTGKVSISNNTIIKFTPDNQLLPNKEYIININLKDILQGEYNKNISYKVKTFNQEMKVEREGVVINADNSITVLINVQTADKVNLDNLKSCFSSDANEVEIMELSPLNYQVELLYQNNLSEKSYVQFDGKPIYASQNGKITFEKLNLDQFAVLSTKRNSNGDFNVYFSQRLTNNADLTGLVTVNGQDSKYAIQDNKLIVYTNEFRNDQSLKVEIFKGLKSSQGKKLINDYTFTLSNEVDKPSVKYVSEGNYFPSIGEFKIPIKTRALEKIRLTVIEIKQENVRHYLAWQSLQYGDFYNLRMFGKPIYNEVVPLTNGSVDEEGWTVYGIDLQKQLNRNPGSIYNISLSFEPSFVSLSCKADLVKQKINSKIPDASFFNDKNYNYYDNEYYRYDWNERNDPCKITYYLDQGIPQRNFICSDYSIIAKQAGNDYFVALNKLSDLTPVSGADISLYDLQSELIKTQKTSSQGFAKFDGLDRSASLVQVNHEGKVTFLSFDEGMSNPLTEFNIAGDRSAKDGQFFIYTERDVWRPGDSIYVDLMVNKNYATLPAGLPITLSFFNTENLLIKEETKKLDLDKNQIYSFLLKTDSQSKTGIYRCKIEVGTQTLSKNIRIENIKPNTAEIIFSLDNEKDDVVLSNIISGSFKAQYLNGFELKNAIVKADARGIRKSSPFKKYEDYNFSDYREVDNSNFNLFNTKTNENGVGSIRSSMDFSRFNGPLKLYIETETTLSGGGVNKQGSTVDVSPLESYIGAKRNKGKGWRDNYLFSEDPQISLVSITQEGKPNTNKTLANYTIEKHVSQWWIDKYRLRSSSNYRYDNYWEKVKSSSVSFTTEGKIVLSNAKLEKGAYRVVITDAASGHRTMVHFTIYNGVDRIPGAEPYIVEFETDKDEYKAGEEVNLILPDIPNAKALISIERGNKLVEQIWYDLKTSDNKLSISTFQDWAPNVYIHVTVIQKYLQQENDLPLRMYGIKPIKIDAEDTQLLPVVDIPEKLESNKTYAYQVSEKNGKPMEYTLAFVDEGLLNLTGFSTPDPYNHFNGKFPLLVKTWDIYKYLMLFFRGDYAGILSIGGDDAYKADAIPEVNRFKAVVNHIGPFKLKANGKANHDIKIPNYIGKLRIMVVACSEENFGKLEKHVLIKNPLMVQSQFPRALNVSDKLSLPITIFRDDNNINTASLNIKTDDNKISGLNGKNTITFNGENQITKNLDVEVLNKAGVLNIDMEISGNNKSMKEATEILINYPNSYESDIEKHIIQKGENLNLLIQPKGYADVFESNLQISGLKTPKFVEYAQDLIGYPYGCLEQTVSKGFAQLYLDKIIKLNPDQNRRRMEHLQAAINKIVKYQTSDGKYSYWDNGYYHVWSDLYAGNFLTELSNNGYLEKRSPMLSKWTKYHENIASRWSFDGASDKKVYEKESIVQAYRLFILAKSGNPAKSAMNRFSSSNTSQNPLTWWFIAGAYKISGYDSKALEVLNKAESLQITNNYSHYYYTFGDQARDMAMKIEILSYFKDQKAKSDLYYDKMVDILNEKSWVSTHTKGYSFLASYKYFGSSLDLAKTVDYDVKIATNKDNYQHSSVEPNSIKVPASAYNKNIEIVNNSDGKLFVYQVNRFIDDNLKKEAKSSNLDIQVSYYNTTKSEIGLESISMGDDISIMVNVKNLTALATENLALNLKMPSGWELINPRLYETNEETKGSEYIYQDFKDDRVYTFLNLGPGKINTYFFRAKAVFSGEFYMPTVSCENMYQGDIFANTETRRISVKK